MCVDNKCCLNCKENTSTCAMHCRGNLAMEICEDEGIDIEDTCSDCSLKHLKKE